jgi:N-acetylglucosaminyldiphosphoundecaprenol N-acetyl-beta-D-mannosaminyltransferase
MTTVLDASPDRARVLGLDIDRLTMQETVDRCRELIESGGFAQHVAINAAKAVAAREDPGLRDVIRGCELVTADGQAVVWASRVLGDPLPERVAGIDLMYNLFALAEIQRYRIFILGARLEVLERAVGVLRERHPRLEIAGYRDGYFDETHDAEVAEQIRRASPHILFVAISSPRKEFWLARYGRRIDVPFIMGVGGAIDVVAGVTRRAPRPLQALGLEWSYRLAQEPRRLAGRYWRTNARFLALVARAVAARAWASARRLVARAWAPRIP